MANSDYVVLFRLPTDLVLKLQPDSTRSTSSKTDITTLPYDILVAISDYLDLTDLACLGLTCKSLASVTISLARLPAIQEYIVNGFHPPMNLPLHISNTPNCYTLLPRLAKGWIPREKYKHCWNCNKIYPRNPSFYETKFSMHKAPGWLWKLNFTEQEWRGMDSQQRHKHIICRWLTDDDLVHESLRPPARIYNVYLPDLGIWTERRPDGRGPECPMCLERQLIYSGKTPQSLYPVSMAAKVALMALAKAPVNLGGVVGSTVVAALRSRS